ncbi:MAG TPA: SPOR domain-containing protein [Burkholderiales bacterium]|nr:SPOR domain-containing protein [Burkholderiales bacterium]
MRAFFLFLVLANLVFFAYGSLARRDDAARQIALLQISPERIRLIAAQGPIPAAPAPGRTAPPAQPKAPSACLEWGIFAGPDVARAAAALARLELPQERIERAVTDAGGYWVYIPPLKTKAEVDRKVGELKALGVAEFFVVQEATQWRNAISLGIFRTEEAAKSFLGKLRERGVRSAVAERRENFLKQIAFYVREPDEPTVKRLAEIQREFPGSEIKAAPCPAAQPAQG